MPYKFRYDLNRTVKYSIPIVGKLYSPLIGLQVYNSGEYHYNVFGGVKSLETDHVYMLTSIKDTPSPILNAYSFLVGKLEYSRELAPALFFDYFCEYKG